MSTRKKVKAKKETATGTVQYKLRHILENKFSIMSLPSDFEPDRNGDSLNYRLNFMTGFTNNDEQMTVKITLDCSTKKPIYDFCNLEVTFFFDYSNNSNLSIREIFANDKVFKSHVISLAYSTFRGILFEKGKGTILNYELLPTVQLQALV